MGIKSRSAALIVFDVVAEVVVCITSRVDDLE